MLNIVGQPVSGTDYFERPAITNLIYRRLATGSSLFMAAPRRVGKTSIMYHLRDKPRPGYTFLYVNTESVDSSEIYFKLLFDALLNSKAVGRKVKLSQKVKDLFENVTNRVKSVGAFSVEIALQNKPKEKYADIFLELMKKLDTEEGRMVIMIDEFPTTIENIHQKESAIEAVLFLRLNRNIRQQSAGGIQFIYTGSIGLPHIVNRLDVPESVNDLNPVEVPPLSLEEGLQFTSRLLNAAKVPFSDSALNYLLVKIKWLMPFFIQLSVLELVDLYDASPSEINEKTVDEAFERICNRRNNFHFNSYFKRLKDCFSAGEYNLAMEILDAVSNKDKIEKQVLFNSLSIVESNKRDAYTLIEALVYDGYIKEVGNYFSFNSPILQRWWNKYIHP